MSECQGKAIEIVFLGEWLGEEVNSVGGGQYLAHLHLMA